MHSFLGIHSINMIRLGSGKRSYDKNRVDSLFLNVKSQGKIGKVVINKGSEAKKSEASNKY